MDKYYYNLNSEDDLVRLRNAIRTDQGQAIYEFIFQVFEQQFDEEGIDIHKLDNATVGEKYKLVRHMKNTKKYIDDALFNNNNG